MKNKCYNCREMFTDESYNIQHYANWDCTDKNKKGHKSVMKTLLSGKQKLVKCNATNVR